MQKKNSERKINSLKHTLRMTKSIITDQYDEEIEESEEEKGINQEKE